MADHEQLLLAKAFRDQAFITLVEQRITGDFFIDLEHGDVYDWAMEHYKQYGVSPSLTSVGAAFPNWDVPDTPDPIEYYIANIQKQYKRGVIKEAIQGAVEAIQADDDVEEAERLLANVLVQMGKATGRAVDHTLNDPDDIVRNLEFYLDLRDNPDAIRGYETGWPTIDMATMGLQNGQLITFVGPPKSGKSTVLLSAADHVARTNVPTLLVSFEMSYQEQVARWLGIRTEANYRRFLKGYIQQPEIDRIEKLIKQLTARKRAPIVLSEDISSTTTVSGIIAKIQLHKPKVLFIDGVYLMDDENGEPKGSAGALTNITRSLKRVAQVHQIPVVISTQTLYSKMRGSTLSMGSIGYSSSFGQDSDTVIGLEIREDALGDQEHWLKIMASRSGPVGEALINFDWAISHFNEPAGASMGPDLDLVRIDPPSVVKLTRPRT